MDGSVALTAWHGRFEDHQVWYENCSTNLFHICFKRDVIISFCQDQTKEEQKTIGGSINFSSLLTGRLLKKIPVAEMVELTSIHFDDETGRLFIGSRAGMVQVWSIL